VSGHAQWYRAALSVMRRVREGRFVAGAALLMTSTVVLAQSTEISGPVTEPALELEGGPVGSVDPDLDLNLDLHLDSPGPSDSKEPALRSALEEFLREGLGRVDWLMRAGAYGLAERVLLRQRPSIERTEEWIEWERRLWTLYTERGNWERLVSRIEELPQDLPKDFQLEAREISAEALMQQREFSRARSVLRKLLLSSDIPPTRMAQWRRKIFTSYLWDDDLADADSAMLQYQNDYFPDDHSWNLLRARVLIRSGDPSRAISQIASVTTPEGVLVGLFGRLRNGSMTPNEVIDKALSIDTKAFDNFLKRERYALIAEAARRSGGLPDRVKALEQALAIEHDSLRRPLVEVDNEDLVGAYMGLAEVIANSQNLLVGDYEGWLKYAEAALGDSPIASRAVFAYVGRKAPMPDSANGSFARLASSLRDSGLKPVIFQLFGDGKPLGGFDALRGGVGYLLSEEALEEGDIERAAALSAAILQPPAGVSHFDWRLRQARMLIYAGRVDSGIEILDSLTGALNSLRDDEADRLLQVIFDLQALDRHADALPYLERILELSANAKQQREVLFWIAESLEGTGAHEQAALYFLRSSTMSGDNSMWSQSAQYRAAGALQDAGLLDDARALYRQLLAITSDPARREQLTRKLQDLWLLENKGGLEAADS
jgi:tetratricopeptide (TPR) repeat protein